jgi:TonB-dependent SusC/RagA subfamily outer membrane receptor
MYAIKILMLVVVLALLPESANGQKSKKISVSGTILDVYGMPIPNAIILVDNVMTSSVSDEKGNYTVKVKPEAKVIAASTFGSGIIEEYISGRTHIDFNFKKGASQRIGSDQVSDEQQARMDAESYINTGYDAVKKKDKLDHMSSIDLTKKKRTYVTLNEMVEQLSGVRISNGQVIVLESRNMQGFVPALIVVDGSYFENLSSVSYVKPSSVESITVLKGASAAIYGTRAFGGVLLIKTKNLDSDK